MNQEPYLVVTVPPQLSLVMIAEIFGAGTALAQDTVTSAAQVIDGALVS